MAFPSKTQGAAYFVLAALLLWKPTIVVLFPGLVYTTDLTTVFLSDGCIGSTSQTVFVFCLLEVLVACVLLKGYAVPVLFGEERWSHFDELKQKKLVGFIIKIVVRMSCAVQIIVLVSTQFSIDEGLFAKYNMKQAYKELVENRTITSCADAKMSLHDAAALRAWTFARDDMMAVMVWELAFIPELPLDAWLHHLFVILGVAMGSDPQLLGSRSQMQPLIDGVAFFLVLGATLAAAVEACVLMYHFSAHNAAVQAKWMQASMAVQASLVLLCFVGFPVVLVVTHIDDLGLFACGILLVLAFLAAVEIKMMIVKWAIVKSSRRKALRQQDLRIASFNHDVSKDMYRDDAEVWQVQPVVASSELYHSFNP